METLQQWWGQIQQSSIWQSVFGKLLWIDWLTFFLIIIVLMAGTKKGLVHMFSKLLQIIAVSTLTLQFYEIIRMRFDSFLVVFPIDSRLMVTYAVLGFLFWFIIHFVAVQFGRIFAVQVAPALNIIGGSIFGCLYMIFLLSFLSQAIVLSPWGKLRVAYDEGESYTGPVLAKLAPQTHDVMMRPIRYVKQKIQS